MLKSSLIALALTAAATAAQAHVTLETAEAPVGSTYKAVVRVPHGCGREATLELRVKIPEGMVAVKPMPKPGWQLDIVTGPYARSHDNDGTALAEGVTEITWTGELPDAYYDEFVFRGSLAPDLVPGTMLYFPVVQECASQTERWIEIPAAGQDPEALETPAPGVLLLPAAAAGDDD